MNNNKSSDNTPNNITSNQLTKLSRFLSYILRHKPEEINLSLDSEGYADINQLITLTNIHTDYNLTHSILDQIVSTDSKQRYSYDDTKTKIRANQGHSIPVDLNLTPTIPPDILYHGTAQHSVPNIFSLGLKSMSRQYVHLSSDLETAIKVGKRHCHGTEKPVVFIINSQKAFEAGITFYLSDNNVWLTNRIPREFLTDNYIIQNNNNNDNESNGSNILTYKYNYTIIE